MTEKKDLKSIIRNRMAKTGESYTAARMHALREQERRIPKTMQRFIADYERHAANDGSPRFGTPAPDVAEQVEAAVLKVNRLSARVRLLSTGEEITFRSSNWWDVVPGEVVTMEVRKRWTHRGFAYASGDVSSPRIDIAALGLVPLGLEDYGMMDPREVYDRDPHPAMNKLWSQISKPRHYYEMQQVLPGTEDDESYDIDSDPIIEASELNQAGDREGARKILMDLLVQDLRCLDAHAHLGNFVLDRNPKQAVLHYQVGVAIGEQALGPTFTGLLPWGCIDNRPFLRCLYGYGCALWRLGRLKEAEMVFERMLWLNPNDNQGARFCWLDVREGRSWKEVEEREQQAYQ